MSLGELGWRRGFQFGTPCIRGYRRTKIESSVNAWAMTIGAVSRVVGLSKVRKGGR